MKNAFNLVSQQALLDECALFFALVLHKVVSAIDADDKCLDLLFQAWFLDDGVLAGKKASVLRAVSILKEFGPSLSIRR